MSDTPKTDELLQRKFIELGSLGPHNCPEWLVQHARELERELAFVTADRDSETRWACQYKAERDKAVAENQHRQKSTMTAPTKKYWMVHALHGHAPTVTHASEESATKEAARLAAKHPGSIFVVLESIHECQTQKPEVMVTKHKPVNITPDPSPRKRGEGQ
jgi:hypothetical protein